MSHSELKSLLYCGKRDYNVKQDLIIDLYGILVQFIESRIESLEPTSSLRAGSDNLISFCIYRYIIDKINSCFKNGELIDDDGLEDAFLLMKKETKRLKKNYKTLLSSKKYYRTLLKEDAKNILLDYMSEEEIEDSFLQCYPEVDKELDELNDLSNITIVRKPNYKCASRRYDCKTVNDNNRIFRK